METIVIFAAGMGSRMQDVTKSLPKSLIEINGKPLLQYSLELTKLHHFDRVIINTHYLSAQIEAFLKQYKVDNPTFPEIIIEHEEVLLETAGTIKKLANLYDLGERIFTLNSDVIIRSTDNVFKLMLDEWNNVKPDILLLLQTTSKAFGYVGNGDFYLEENGKIHRNGALPYPYMFAGMHILNPNVIRMHTHDIFSMREYYPQVGDLSNRVNIYGVPMRGEWYHATRPEDVAVISDRMNLIEIM
jgi:MurNAc alpha-1-phosphate uridylyltransferase